MELLTIYTEEELKKIQKLETDALKIIIDICEKLEIEYFLIGGTALGAIRHNGFIPWDDDIDIGMTRNNYIRFLKEAPKYLPKGYFCRLHIMKRIIRTITVSLESTELHL